MEADKSNNAEPIAVNAPKPIESVTRTAPSAAAPRVATPVANAAVEVYLLGTVEYESAMYLQDRLAETMRNRTDDYAAILLCEHPPLITIGRQGSRAHLAVEPGDLISRQLPIKWLNRGGGVVLHAPGQLAAYPIVPLQRRGIGMSLYRRMLNQAVQFTLDELEVPAQLDPESSSIWCRAGEVAHIGAAIRNGVSYHGTFIHVSQLPEVLKLVRPAGDDRRTCSLESQRLKATTMPAVRESLIRHLADALGYSRFHVFTGHPLLRRTTMAMAYA